MIYQNKSLLLPHKHKEVFDIVQAWRGLTSWEWFLAQKKCLQKAQFFLLLVIGRLPFTELSTLHWYHNIASDCWSHSKIRHLIMDGITLGHPWCKRMQLHPKIRCNCVMCRWQASIREAILCQIGCFFTHCVNDPWPPPRFYTIMLWIFRQKC